jgi:hypothetical protein
LNNYYFNEQYHRNDYRAAGKFLSTHALPDDLVIASAAYTSNNLRYYYQGTPLEILEYPQVKNQLLKDPAFVKPTQVASDLGTILQNRNRFWLFLSRTYHSDPNGYIRKYCEENYINERELNANGVNLILYKKPSNNNSDGKNQPIAGFRKS